MNLDEVKKLLAARQTAQASLLLCTFIGPLRNEQEMRAREYHRGFNEALETVTKETP